MKKTLLPPENWQDFETLCKKLFGEIWGCSLTIKQNGRLGQSQAGVDIYDKPKGEEKYWGIQCKGKNNYGNKKLTTAEIDQEIENAKGFKPQLGMFIFTTSAQKDVSIEEHIRIKNEELTKNGLFGVQIFCWEDLVDLIRENRNTYNWYVNSREFKDKFDVAIDITTEREDGTLRPVYRKTIKRYKKIYNTPPSSPFNNFDLGAFSTLAKVRSHDNSYGVSKSWCKIFFSVTNIGGMVLEDWRLNFEFENLSGAINKRPLSKGSGIIGAEWVGKKHSLILDVANRKGFYAPSDSGPLIQKNQRCFELFCRPGDDELEVTIKWHLLARDFDKDGKITLKVNADIRNNLERIPIDDTEEDREEISIEDYYE